MVKVRLGERVVEVVPGTRILEILGHRSFSSSDRTAALPEHLPLAARVNGTLMDLTAEIHQDCTIEPVEFQSPEGRSVYWHSASHLMAQAVLQLFPGTRLAIGPATDEGFYYDFDMPQMLTDQDLAAIENRMKELAQQDIPLTRKLLSRQELLAEYQQEGNPYKVELLQEIADDQVSVYEQGDFRDLCRGPHLPSTGYIKAIKLLSVAGAYWRGDERNKMLQRIYGITFPSDQLLQEYLERIEQAKQRDHRRLGPALGLFSFHDEAGAGLVFWHPKGATIRQIIERYWIEEHEKAGYQLVVTPHIGRARLWHTSGHYDFYRENMFVLPVANEEYVLKPMNCPGHILIYRTAVHSYRDLPLRLGEWGTVYRNERSGTLHGALRARGFTQDDAHIFCTEEQIEDEVYGVVSLALKILNTFGFREFAVDLSVRDPQHKSRYMGADRAWELAEASLVNALNRVGLKYTRAEGEATFYGPKIDIKLFDSLGRQFQCPTCQFDFNLAERFDVYYMGPDGQHHQVYLVHRTILGAIERFVALLVEHYAGAFPVWLSPIQAMVMTVTGNETDYACRIQQQLSESGIRVQADLRDENISTKIGEAERAKIPYMLVIGKREQQNQTVALRRRAQGNLGAVPVSTIIEQIKEDNALKR